jgi:hypothetical protein
MRRLGQAITWLHLPQSARANGRVGGRLLGGSPVFGEHGLTGYRHALTRRKRE